MADDSEETTTNPDAEELAALRKEKADRAAAEAKAKEDELEALRAFKADQEAKAAKAVKAPVKKADKPEPDPTPPPVATAAVTKKRGKSGAARSWFGEEDD